MSTTSVQCPPLTTSGDRLGNVEDASVHWGPSPFVIVNRRYHSAIVPRGNSRSIEFPLRLLAPAQVLQRNTEPVAPSRLTPVADVVRPPEALVLLHEIDPEVQRLMQRGYQNGTRALTVSEEGP